MNKTEALAHEWLKSHGYKGVFYQRNRDPSFLTEDGGFEVKRAYTLKGGVIKIIFQVGQRERLAQQGYHVLVFSEDHPEPLDVINPEELKLRAVRGIIFHEYGTSRGSRRAKVSGKVDASLLRDIEVLKEEHFQLADWSRFLEMLLRKGYEQVSKELRVSRDLSVIHY